jgi:polar amino acid transport system substrate-binding protein
MNTLINLMLAGAALLTSTAVAAEPDTARLLAPSGTLRAAINFGNPVLAQRDKATGEPRGVSVALARELGQRLGVPVRFVIYEEAGLVAAAAVQDAWDVAFLAVNPIRGATIEFTSPYVLIEGTYVVPPNSKLDDVDAVDQPGVRICVATNSAYDLFLSRALQHAELVRFAGGGEAEAAFLSGAFDALAGVKQPLAALVRTHPALRLQPGRFMAIRQAMAVPKSRAAGIPFLRSFVEDAKASGFVRAALDATGQHEAEVALAE